MSLLVEIMMKTDLIDKLDDSIIFILAIIALVWYFKGNNKFRKSLFPFTIALLVFLVKICAFIIEFDDKAAVGDEFGLLIPLLLITIISLILYNKSKKIERKPIDNKI